MADTTFVNGTTPIVADWLNDVNDYVYGSSLKESVQTTLSGKSSVTYDNLPDWVNRINIFITNASYSGAANLELTLGDADGLETDATYYGTQSYITATDSCDIIVMDGATEWTLTGGLGTVDWVNTSITLQRAHPTLDVWSLVTTSSEYNSTAATQKATTVQGIKQLSGTLTQFSLGLSANTWDAGIIYATYE